MKKLMTVLAAVMLMFAMTSSVWAADVATGSVGISTSIAAKCSDISASDLTLTIDPETSTDVTSTGGATTVKCTNNKSFNVSAASVGSGNTSTDGTLDGTMKDGTKSLNYTLAFTSNFTGAGFGSVAATTLVTANAATVTAADANAAEEGSYSDTVTITVSY